MIMRKIVLIDEEKCDGCGDCVPSCHEGAIRIVDGKARLVSDIYCDGLGACLGVCPRGAISIVERQAAPFDEAATQQHVAQLQAAPQPALPQGCPGAAARELPVLQAAPTPCSDSGPESTSALGNWPVQLHLAPPQAPFLQGADLLLAADCVPFAYADFHGRLLRGRPVLVGCPKLDDGQAYVEKLAAMLRLNAPASLTVVHMEVPCCLGLMQIVQAALQRSSADVPLHQVVISVDGKLLSETTLSGASSA